MQTFDSITPDGRTGFDQFGQLMTWTVPDADGYKTGRIIKDVRSCTCYICGKGWGNTSEELADQARHDDLDMHKTCYFGHRKMQERQFWIDSLMAAGYLFKHTEVETQYPGSTPWQQITVLGNDTGRTDTGIRLVVGRRKSVWELRVHGVGELSCNFADVEDTLGYDTQYSPLGPHFYVHAYTKAQVIDYLTRFRLAIPCDTDRNACKY